MNKYEVFIDNEEEKSDEDLRCPDASVEAKSAWCAAEQASGELDLYDERVKLLVHDTVLDQWWQFELEETRYYQIRRADEIKPADFMIPPGSDGP